MEQSRQHSFIRTRSGKNFYPFEPRAEAIIIEDIAWALSHLCRYTGHSKFFYSVAQHSIYVSDYLEEKYGLAAGYAGLLHDAPEAYINDLATPFKRHLDLFNDVEDGIMNTMMLKFKIDRMCFENYVPEGDMRVFLSEAEQLMDNPSDWEAIKKLNNKGLTALPIKILEMPYREVQEIFLLKFYRYQEDLGL